MTALLLKRDSHPNIDHLKTNYPTAWYHRCFSACFS